MLWCPTAPDCDRAYKMVDKRQAYFEQFDKKQLRLPARRLVRSSGFEPPRYCYRQPLKLVRLPVPPRPHRGERYILAAGSEACKPDGPPRKNRKRRAEARHPQNGKSTQKPRWIEQLQQ
jgi:hypothetical protein